MASLCPAVLLAGQSSVHEQIRTYRFSSRPQAMDGSTEGRVPLALSAQDRVQGSALPLPRAGETNGKLQHSRV